MSLQQAAYSVGYNDGVDGVIRENPYTDAVERNGYSAGRAAGEAYYRECSERERDHYAGQDEIDAIDWQAELGL